MRVSCFLFRVDSTNKRPSFLWHRLCHDSGHVASSRVFRYSSKHSRRRNAILLFSGQQTHCIGRTRHRWEHPQRHLGIDRHVYSYCTREYDVNLNSSYTASRVVCSPMGEIRILAIAQALLCPYVLLAVRRGGPSLPYRGWLLVRWISRLYSFMCYLYGYHDGCDSTCWELDHENDVG